MGEVWRARDVRLSRLVALKILSSGLVADRSAVERFEAEARLASGINHPHIVAVYDVGAVDGAPYIAMELVDGENLASVLKARRLAIEEVTEWGLQVAQALAAAHHAGIVHRDVKPANIFLAHGEYAKLGDFGIAKLREAALDPAATVESGASGGIVVGSPHYLSPEQARGESLDPRTDIFSFAATLYEMTTGRRAFDGSSASEVIAAVLHEEPADVRTLRPDVPPLLQAVVGKGLEKRREYRYQHMDDVVSDLRRLKRDLEAGRAYPLPLAAETRAPVPGGRAGRHAIVAAAVAAGALGTYLAGIFVDRESASRDAASVEVVRLTSGAGVERSPSWSPDGRSVAYVSDRDGHLGIWIRQVPGERAIRVSLPGVDEAQPVWSPDGERIAFVSARNRGGRLGIFLGSRPIEIYVFGQDGDLFVMPAFGGTARKLADDAYDPTWSPDGSRLAFRSVHEGEWRLYTAVLETGEITRLDGVEPRALEPAWSPDGRWIAYVGGASAATGWDIFLVPATGGKPVQLTHDRTSIALAPTWSRDGSSIIYSSNRAGPLNLWRLPIDRMTGRATGPPERLTTGIGEDIDPSVSPNGSTISYATVRTAPDIWVVDVAARQLRQLTSETTVEDFPRLSSDGRHLSFYSDRTGAEEVWVMRLSDGELTRISRQGGTQNAWFPDGRRLAFGTRTGLVIADIRDGLTRTVAEGFSVAYPAVSRDGRHVAFQGWNGTNYRLYDLEVETNRLTVIATPDGEPGNPSWSPDGGTVFFQLDQFGRRNIWSMDLASGQTRQLTQGDADDAHPDVSSDGGRLLFLRNHREIYVMPVDGTAPPDLVVGFPERSRLVEWPAWGPHDASIVFSVAEMSGDLFLLQPAGHAVPH